MKTIKDLFRRLAIVLVTWQSNRWYNKAVKVAEERHRLEKTRIYVAEDLLKENRLYTYDRKQFRRIKEIMKIRTSRYSVVLLKDGAYYYTADGGGNGKMSRADREARRLAFIRMNLIRARLIEK